ncbi:MAG: transposase family protein [Candidatus Obscuribacter sp.]|nr:transposase family protein [Candidatus Obscuribacter sp.]
MTKLKGPHAWQFYFLYTIVDLYSRKVVGWMVAERENAKHAKRLFREVCRRERADSRQLIVHSDRGSTMTSLTLGLLFSSLGIVKSLSRPRVSNDNAFVESLFKTLKYRQLYPKRFYSLDEAQKYMREFFSWYNTEHYHSGVCHLTPHAVHSGLAASILKSRQAVADTAYAKSPRAVCKWSAKGMRIAHYCLAQWTARKRRRKDRLTLVSHAVSELSEQSGNLDYVSNRYFEIVHPMGVFEIVERAQRIMGYP